MSSRPNSSSKPSNNPYQSPSGSQSKRSPTPNKPGEDLRPKRESNQPSHNNSSLGSIHERESFQLIQTDSLNKARRLVREKEAQDRLLREAEERLAREPQERLHQLQREREGVNEPPRERFNELPRERLYEPPRERVDEPPRERVEPPRVNEPQQERAYGSPPRAQIRLFNFITMRRYWLDSTSRRARISEWIILFGINVLSAVAGTVFWLAAIFCLYSISYWQHPMTFLRALTRGYFSGSLSTTFWSYILPNFSDSPHLRLAVHTTSYMHSRIICSWMISLPLDNTMFCLLVMVLMFIAHYLLGFAHDRLSNASLIRTANRHLY